VAVGGPPELSPEAMNALLASVGTSQPAPSVRAQPRAFAAMPGAGKAAGASGTPAGSGPPLFYHQVGVTPQAAAEQAQRRAASLDLYRQLKGYADARDLASPTALR
jgi:hypothetical protein